MARRDPAIVRAEKLRMLMSLPEYKETVAAWIEEAHRSALHDMTAAKEPYQFHAAQGAYNAIETIRQQFERVFSSEKAAIAKLEKTRNREEQ